MYLYRFGLLSAAEEKDYARGKVSVVSENFLFLSTVIELHVVVCVSIVH